MERRTVIALAGVLLLLLPPVLPAEEAAPRDTGSETWELVETLEREVLLPPGGSYSVSYSPPSGGLAGNDGYSNLTAKARQAVGAVPVWLAGDLKRQFCELGAGADRYAELVLNAADARFVDEIAFAVAHTSPDILKVPSFNPGVFSDNAASIYAADPYLAYVNITEKADHTTVTYTNATGAKVELPRDIYYWYIVHPKITGETPLYINPANGAAVAPPTGKFWRDYLLNHNDAGYPLLRDALAGVPTLWNGTKNSFTNNGAVGVVTKWILDVMEFGSGNERPTQPVRIYALHLGRCGEHEDITCAAARACLIPCIGAEDIAEDHVWNEFWYDGAWHQWEPVNVYVDFPESYGGWGKKFPAVSAWRGDDSAWTETAIYTQVATLRISVVDRNGVPVEGASVWLGGEYSGSASYRMLASWNSTNETGVAVFEVGKGTNIYARADSEKAGGAPTASASSTGANPWVLFSSDTSTVVTNAQPIVYNHTLALSGALPYRKSLASQQPMLNGSYKLEMTAEVAGSEVRGRSALGYHYFRDAPPMPVYSFVADAVEWNAFGQGKGFKCHDLREGLKTESAAILPRSPQAEGRGEYFAVVANDAAATVKTVKVTVKVYVAPYITLERPAQGKMTAGGGLARLEGLADGVNVTSVQVSTGDPARWEDAVFNKTGRSWTFEWNTGGLPSGNYTLRARLLDGLGETDSNAVTVILDAEDPVATLATEGVHPGGPLLVLAGSARDDLGVATVSVDILYPSGWRTRLFAALDAANGTWSRDWETAGGSSGDYLVTVTVRDLADRTGTATGAVTLDFDPPAVYFGTTGLFRGGMAVRLEGTAQDDIGLRSVTVIQGDKAYNAAIEGGLWSLDWDTAGLPSGTYKLTALAEDLAGWNARASTTIKLDADLPAIDIEAPATAEAGSAIALAGTVRDPNGVQLSELCTDGENWTELDPDESGDWSFDWYTAALMPGNFTISVRAFDTVGNTATVGRTVRLVDTTAPEITLEMLKDVQAGENLTVKVKLVERTGIELVEYSTDGKEWKLMEPGAKGWTASMDTRALPLGKNRVRVRAYDVHGNLAEVSKDVTVNDDIAPSVTITDLIVNKGSLSAGGRISDNYNIRHVAFWIDSSTPNNIEISGDYLNFSTTKSMSIGGSTSTSFSLDNGAWSLTMLKLKGGTHTLKLRATDGSGKTAETSREFRIEEPKPAAKGFIPGFGAGLLAAALLIGIGLAGRGRRAPRKD